MDLEVADRIDLMIPILCLQQILGIDFSSVWPENLIYCEIFIS